MFKKILIANRGEIACRVIKTCRKMGIETVAVYSDADADGLHVDMADEAVRIGAAPAAESYLLADKIIAAAIDTGAEAIHPGFGFLSEKAAFVKAVKAAGLTFIGPDEGAIEDMGDKIASKKLAKEAGVSTVPGHMDIIASPDEAARISSMIGYPVMLKASAGGGGKGMRIAFNDHEAREGFISAQNEARASFGDDRVFIEKFVEEPRHIEIQILGDKHGDILYLHERECSIQRRHQKVVEEAPSPFLDPATRKAMGEQAVALARAVKYHSAGTVEFIVDKNRNFYFLEMNTRLQVEHPVTEMITGIDLVEQMIRVAAGEKLSFSQEDVKINGWAVETRVYAEDPFRNFLPSIGRLAKYRAPEETDHVRVDAGVFEGAEISMYYDPMIAKLITWDKTRAAAISRMRSALDGYYVRGISHNIPFLSALMAHPRFQSGAITTKFIEEEYPEGFKGGILTDAARDAMLAAAAYVSGLDYYRETMIGGQTMPRKALARDWVAVVNAREHVEISADFRDGGANLVFAGRTVAMETDWRPGQPVFRARVDGRDVTVEIDRLKTGMKLTHDGVSLNIAVLSPRIAELFRLMPEKKAADTSKFLLCPMPGMVVSVNVAEGDAVAAGQALAVVEAMKMENILRAERDGTVKAVKAKAGQSLAVDAVILEFA